MDEHEAYIALNMMSGIGPVTVSRLKESLGSATAVFRAGEKELASVRGIGRDMAGAIIRQRTEIDWQAEIARAADSGARIVAFVDDEYPARLRGIYDPPLAVYVRGEFTSRDSHAVAVVGTRRPTHYGLAAAERLSWQLARAGVTIVSGLARGIDTAAHEGALKAGGRTIAVIGSGLGCVYPESNAGLADRIAGQGAVISEFPFDRQPDKTTFPMRNRIVSGLSRGVLVIEAGRRSGALITANQALEQGRDVFAVPGRIDSSASLGSNDLIRNGARLVTSADDILDEFEFLLPRSAAGAESPGPELDDQESAIMALLEGGEQDVDGLIRASGMKPGAVSALLIGLEMKKAVRMLPGRVVERIERV